MRKEKAFTMIELIIVIIIIGVILVFVLPNITSIIERNNRKAYASDAADFIEKTKNCVITGRCEYPTTTVPIKTYTLEQVDVNNDIDNSAYSRTNSVVQIKLVNGEYKYSVEIKDSSNNTICAMDYGEEKCH